MDEKNFVTRKASTSSDVLEFYDEYAKTWDERFGKTESVYEFHNIRLQSLFKVTDFSEEKIAAELGVGTGPYIESIAPKVKELICIDGSSGMLEVLKQKTKNLPNCRVINMDLSQPLKEVDFTADIIYGFGLIEHIINIHHFIENCKIMLKPNGKVIFISTNALSPWYYGLRFFSRAGNHCSTDKHFTKNQLNSIMDSHGFIETGHVYWGFFPAGIEGSLYKFLKFLGKFLEKSPLRKFSGGMTVSYQLR